MENREELLYTYACEKFEQQKYDEALEAFILLYGKGYERDWIKNSIYQCYVDGNESQFRSVFELHAKGIKVNYEDCKIDFVPYKDGQYYMFDKEIQQFIGIFSIDDFMQTEPDPLLKQKEFSAITVAAGWDWRRLNSILIKAEKQRVYLVCEDIDKCAAFYKIPELEPYTKNIWIFPNISSLQEYFHDHTAEYLPGIWYGDEEDRIKLEKMIQEEHEYRLTPEGRNTDRILLTIAIPTYHRGHLLLQRMSNLQKLPYDAEIEFTVSKNGTEIYQAEYDKASQIKDARLQYFDHNKDLKYELNWLYSIQMAHGKYVLLVSDEDDVIPEAIEHYLALLRDNPNVNLVRARTKFQYCMIDKRAYGKKGIDALRLCFMGQNYLSGLIVRRKDFMQCHFEQLERYSDNAFYQTYPHEWWCVSLNKIGDYIQEPVELIDEQDSMAKEEWGYKDDVDADMIVPVYATYEARIKQMKGEIEFLKIMLSDDEEMLVQGMAAVMGKIDILFGIARVRKYDVEHYEDRLKEYVEICMDAIMNFNLDGQTTKGLLIYLQELYIELLKEHSDLLEEEKNNK